MNKLKINIAVILTLIFAAMNTFSQAAIKTDEGFLFVNNGDKKSFTLEIKGKVVNTMESSVPMFMVDGKLLQILIVPLTNFTDQAKGKTDEQILEMHKVWESDFLGKEVYLKTLPVETERMSFAERKSLFWGFVRPSKNKEFDGDYFMTTILGDYLLAVGSSTTKTYKKDDAKKFLSDLVKTMNVSDKEFDIEKMASEIKEKPNKK